MIIRDHVASKTSQLEIYTLEQEPRPRLVQKYSLDLKKKATGVELDGRVLQVIFEDGTIELRFIPEALTTDLKKLWALGSTHFRTHNFGKGITVSRLLLEDSASDLTPTHILAVGGVGPGTNNGRDLELFRSAPDSTYSSIWKAKNVKHNAMGLAVPFGISQIEFVPGCAAPSADKVNYQLVVGTQFGHLRAYDTVKSRRPVLTYDVSKEAVVQMKVLPSSISADAEPSKFAVNVVVSDTKGQLTEYAVHSGKSLGNFPGSTGEVAGVVTMENGIAAVGYDRYLRVYEGRKCVSKVYWAGRGVGVAVIDGEDEVLEEEEKGSDAEDNVWEEMEEAEEAGKKRKARSSEAGRKKSKSS